MATSSTKQNRPKPRRSSAGFTLYPVYRPDGRLIWVTVPED